MGDMGKGFGMGGYGCGGGGGKGKDLRPGDWYCPACNDLQFSRNDTCRKCGEPRPGGGGGKDFGGFGGFGGKGGGGKMSKPGDWNCPACGDLQFARNSECRKCGEPAPAGAGKGARDRSRS